MNDWIKRYVHDVARRLPESQRDEVKKELEANIGDMLPEQPTEADIKAVLTTLGAPRILASNYRGKQRYLISPEWMEEYLHVLKIVIIIFAAIALISGLVERIINPETDQWFAMILEVLFGAFADLWNSAFNAFAIVTLIFAGIEYGYRNDKKREAWKPEDLPQLPKENVRKIARGESIAGIIFSTIFGVLWVYFVWNNQTYFIAYNDGVVIAPIFVDAVIKSFLPFFIVTTVLTILNHYFKLVVGHWTVSIAASHTVEQVFSLVVMMVFFTTPGLLNPELLDSIATFFVLPLATIQGYIAQGANWLIVFIGIVTLIDIISTWVKTLRRQGASSKAR
jgi:hypothetical protein